MKSYFVKGLYYYDQHWHDFSTVITVEPNQISSYLWKNYGKHKIKEITPL